jgi:hypothetical protein
MELNCLTRNHLPLGFNLEQAGSEARSDVISQIGAISERQERMGTLARNVIAYILGVVIGGIVNMGLIRISGQVIPDLRLHSDGLACG